MDVTYKRDESAGYLTNWAGRLFVRAIERRLAGGSAGPMPVFFALADGGTMSQTALARWASVEQPTMANTLNRMERDKLIERTPDPNDRRSALIGLTRLGRQRAEAERDVLFALLHRIARNLDADAQESAPPALPVSKPRTSRRS